MPTVQLIVRENCSMCTSALQIVTQVCARFEIQPDVIDITAPPAIDEYARWADMVPVVLVDGTAQGFWTIDEQRLTAAILAAGADQLVSEATAQADDSVAKSTRPEEGAPQGSFDEQRSDQHDDRRQSDARSQQSAPQIRRLRA